MLRCTIVLLVALTVAGCRAGFPALNGGPDAPPSALSAAKADAPEASSQLQQEQAALDAARIEAERDSRNTAVGAPRKLLAALPLAYAETAPAGVIDRAVEASEASNRTLVIVNVGAGADRAADVLAAAMEARGVLVSRETSQGEPGAPGRVDLYLGA
jgi:hypothetical protein